MKGLLIKEFLSLRKFVRNILVFAGAFFAMSLISGDISMIATIIPVYFAMVVMSSFSIDEHSHWSAYGAALPVTRTQMVLSKYLLALLASSFGVLLSIGVFLFGKTFTNDQMWASYGMVLVVLLLISLIIPLIYKFGTEHIRYLFFAIGFLPVLIVTILNRMGVPTPTEEQMARVLQLAPVLVVACFIGSIAVSIHIFKRKDL